ncbi:MAG TPA: patatin-like phospholipase family protein [Elusimicrobiota bacterium]|nr:patatin-like phospholipase family protein [Elusimicrobiota bacterium]
MKIGLALSGGGVRATVFHLGTLARLAESPRWADIKFVSTVSGGSLCIALVFEKSGQRWPGEQTFLTDVLPKIKALLTTFDLEARYKLCLFLNPRWWLTGRAGLIARLIRKHWGIVGNVSQMPDSPRWEICATCYETGKNWRFSRKRMGDYIANYVVSPAFPLAEAVAASAAVPGMIGPLSLDAAKHIWLKYAPGGADPTIPAEPLARTLTLWDGGVYDNLGTEVMFKPQGGLRPEIDFLIISDASRPLRLETRRFQLGLPPYVPPFRLIDVATDQARALRLRTFLEFLSRYPTSGAVLRMGNTVESILKKATSQRPARWAGKRFMDESAVLSAAGIETTLRRLSESEYDGLFQHGYEVADATLHAYGHTAFNPA